MADIDDYTVDEYCDLLTSEVSSILEIHAPLRTITTRRGAHDPRWLTDEAKAAKRLSRRLERRFKKTGDEHDRRVYSSARREACKKISDSRAANIRDKMSAASGNPKSMWKAAKEVLHQDRDSVDMDEAECRRMTTLLSDFFTKKLQRIRLTINAALSSVAAFVTFPVRSFVRECLTGFSEVTDDEVIGMLEKMPGKSSPMDAIPTSLLKSCADVFGPIIARLANISFRDGRFPKIFKTAQITPLLKKPGLDRSVSANFRPISNLNTISKVLERLVLNRIRPHLDESGNLSHLQSAYRAGHSTETALLRVLDDLYSAIDGGRPTVLVSLDISAAFDMVRHESLVDRLRDEFGITGKALDWMQSYLSERSQFVKIGSHRSPTVSCGSGVPQGSVLGPILFSVYVSPIANVVAEHGVGFHQFADDMQIYVALRSRDRDMSALQSCTDDVRNWYLQNDLLLNPEVSEVIAFGTTSSLRAAELTSVKACGVELPVALNIKSLGVVLDRRLTFDKQVQSIGKSCNYHLWALRHIRHLVSQDVAHTLACSIVMSRMDYCNSLLIGAPEYVISKLQRVQNNLARIVTGSSHRTHAAPLLSNLHWLPVRHRMEYTLALITYKVRATSNPGYLKDLLVPAAGTGYSLRSSSRPLLTVPRTRTVTASRSFSCAAATVWNKLPDSVINCKNMSTFKSKLKTHYFKKS